MGTKTQKQRKCCYHNLNAKQLIPTKWEAFERIKALMELLILNELQ